MQLVAVCVDDPVLRHAIRDVIGSDRMWRTSVNPAQARVVVTAPTVPIEARDGLRLAVVPPRPATCRDALLALEAGQIHGVVSTPEIDDLPAALAALDRGLCVVSCVAATAARAMPQLTTREKCVLLAVAAGASNRCIASDLHVSEATVKRDIYHLLRNLGESSRTGLARVAVELGVSGGSRL